MACLVLTVTRLSGEKICIYQPSLEGSLVWLFMLRSILNQSPLFGHHTMIGGWCPVGVPMDTDRVTGRPVPLFGLLLLPLFCAGRTQHMTDAVLA